MHRNNGVAPIARAGPEQLRISSVQVPSQQSPSTVLEIKSETSNDTGFQECDWVGRDHLTRVRCV